MKDLSSAMKSPQLILGVGLTGFVLIVTLISFFWTPWDPIGIDVESRLLPPNSSHWFGTDRLGRDLLSQIMVGSQNTLYVTLGRSIYAHLGYRNCTTQHSYRTRSCNHPRPRKSERYRRDQLLVRPCDCTRSRGSCSTSSSVGFC